MEQQKNFNKAFGIDAEKMKVIIRMIFIQIRMEQAKHHDINLNEIERDLIEACFN